MTRGTVDSEPRWAQRAAKLGWDRLLVRAVPSSKSVNKISTVSAAIAFDVSGRQRNGGSLMRVQTELPFIVI
jgi:hypothetical protein